MRERRKRQGAPPEGVGERRFLPSFHFAHRLALAQNLPWWPTWVVIQKLQDEFGFFESDDHIGIRYAESLVRHLERLQNREHWTRRQEQIEQLSERLSQSLYVRYGDEPNSPVEFLETLLLPSTPIVFRYLSEAHAEAAYPLVTRTAQVLGYSISELHGVDLVF
jgi:hypothetical protein